MKRKYKWADKDKFMREVKVEGDDREWLYTAECMYKGELHARVVYFDIIPGIPVHGASRMRKKLVPMRKVKFL